MTQIATNFGPQKCWKNNLGYCRARCLDTERYILLCQNKLSCCISLKLSFEYPRPPPPPPIHLEDIRMDNSDLESYTGAAVSGLNDLVTFNTLETPEATTSQKTYSPPVLPPEWPLSDI
ncbi:PREDICTED: beta-defensin 125 [Propithecus coquereli]|uniref:beta-defensin 125 n=1 Tax=Propithecus coquereli TaxID=379532 RepID=UPI00063F9DD5|nr:PREDICTED: beta-defensin 125 [Propithecus coquereli]